jgi:hypothetical protein
MERRTLLATIGSSLLAAGCVSGSSEDDGTTTDGTPTDGTPTDGTPTDGTPTATPGDGTRNEGDSVGASFEDIECPSFTESDRTICTHSESDTDADVALRVPEAVFTPTTDDDSVETMEITLQNGSDTWFGLNPYEWRLKRQTDEGWTHVAPEEYIEPWWTLDAGETVTWELAVESHPTPEQDDVIAITEDLDSGTYAFQMTGFLHEAPPGETPADDEDEKTLIECVALFKVSRS